MIGPGFSANPSELTLRLSESKTHKEWTETGHTNRAHRVEELSVKKEVAVESQRTARSTEETDVLDFVLARLEILVAARVKGTLSALVIVRCANGDGL